MPAFRTRPGRIPAPRLKILAYLRRGYMSLDTMRAPLSSSLPAAGMRAMLQITFSA
jgi:hypothetical protein